MSTIICPGCKEEINDSIKSCPYCGMAVDKDASRHEIQTPKRLNIFLKFFLVFMGIFGAGVIFLVFIAPQFSSNKIGSYNSDSKSNLHRLYLGCKMYWANNGADKECNVSIASQPENGFDKWGRVNIEGHGTESTFTATAQHEDSTTRYTIDSEGIITEKK